ncbi:MAG: polysaccharide biosynthesis protein [Solirubrobacterales bacterium]|nr:polysaccharide biosynthesis protein [Solirubrobacterales bacterium]
MTGTTISEPDLLAAPGAGRAVVRGTTLRIGSFVGGSLFSVGAAALLFRHLGVIEAGRYTTATSLSALVTGLTDLGLTGVCIRELSVLRGERRVSFARNLMGLRLVLAAIGIVLITSFAFVAYGRSLGLGVLIAGCGVLIQNTQVILASSLSVRLRLGSLSVLEFARQFITAVMITLLVLYGAHLLAFLAVAALAAFVMLTPTVALVRGDMPLRPSFDTRRWRELAGPMLTYSAAVLTATVYLRVAVILVSLLCPTRQLGYLSVSYRVVENLFIIPGLFVGSVFPILAHAAQADTARFAYAISRMFDVALVVGVWFSLSLAVGARLAIEVVGGASFRPAVPVLAVQGIAVAAVFVGNVWAFAMLSLHLHRIILLLNLALLALLSVTVAALAPLYGAQGAAVATAAVEVGAAVAGGLALVRGRAHLKPSLRILPKVVIAAVIAASAMLLTGAPVIGRVALSSALYAMVLLALKALPSELPGLFFGARRAG